MNKTLSQNTFLGISFALGAFSIWGLAPLFWKQISNFSGLELLGHRILWGCIWLTFLMFLQKGKYLFREIKEKWEKTLLLTSFLITINWFLFVWSVNSNHIVDASLAYYLSPIVNVLTGHLFFREKLGVWRGCALILAATGVGILFFFNSGKPWVSLLLTASFSIYAYFKKKSSLSAQSALLVEMAIWALPALVYFVYLSSQGRLQFVEVSFTEQAYISLAGVITVAPLWFYNTAIKHMELGAIGFFQYLAPTLQLLVGVLLFNEAFGVERIVSFSFIWAGIIAFSLDGILKNEKRTT